MAAVLVPIITSIIGLGGALSGDKTGIPSAISSVLGATTIAATHFIPPTDECSTCTSYTISAGLEGFHYEGDAHGDAFEAEDYHARGALGYKLRHGHGIIRKARAFDNTHKLLGEKFLDASDIFASYHRYNHPYGFDQYIDERQHFFEIEGKTGNQPASIELTGTNNGTCVAYVTSSWPDGQKFAWVGSWGRACGLAWYWSGLLFDGIDDLKNPVLCTWLGSGRAGANQFASVLKINWGAFTEMRGDVNGESNATERCGSGGLEAWSRFGSRRQMLPQPIPNTTLHTRDSIKGGRSDNRLVVSNMTLHSAIQVCLAHNSFGPDFISLVEGKYGIYCNMHTGEMLSVCGESVTEDCYDLDDHKHMKRDGDHVFRNPSSIIYW